MARKRIYWQGSGVLVFVAGLVAALLLSACAPAPPSTGKNVLEIGLIADLTGAASAAVYQPFMVLSDYTRYFNEELGIPEVTVQIIWVDSSHEMPKAMSAYRKFVERGVPVMITICGGSEVFTPMCARDKVPLFVFSVPKESIYPPGWVYTIYPTEGERFAIVADWIMENWKGEKAPRIAFLGPDAPMGWMTYTTGSKYAQNLGIEVLPMEIVPYVPLDVTPQLLRLSEQGADYAYVASIWTAAIPVLRDAERLGLLSKIQFGGHENTQSMSMLKTMGAAAEGYFAPRPVPWCEEVEISGIKLLRELMVKYHGKVQVEGDEANPLRMASIVCEVLKRAVEKVGYENVDGSAVKEALDSLNGFDPYGIGPVTYTSQDHRGSTRVRIYQVQNAEVVPVTDWREAPMLAS